MFGRSYAPFERLVERATSQLLLEPDWDTIMQICDSIRQGDVPPKYALTSLKKKINHENPHVAMFGLQVLESCVKNCGSTFHQEVATKEFMEFLKDLLKTRPDTVKKKILELVQVWSNAFKNDPSLKVVQDTYQILKMEGHDFPEVKESEAMFIAERAPEWKDADCCHRCRVQFGLVQRKHHCRACGQIFCGKCSSRQSIIPKFGIEREVRVCDSCYDQINQPGGMGVPGRGEDDEQLPPEYLASPLAQQSQAPPQRSEAEIQEEEELQLAIALSQSEAENKKKEQDRLRNNYSIYSTVNKQEKKEEPTSTEHAPSMTTITPVFDTSDMDPELARYLNRNYWEKKHDDQVTQAPATSTTQPSAPAAFNEPTQAPSKVAESFQNGVDDNEEFLNALKSSIDIFVNRMKSNHSRGRSIANDSSVQTLFMTISSMHPQLMKHVSAQEESRAYYEGLQDKLAQLRDAREALDSLRADHAERRRKEEEEAQRQRQIAMARQLEIMRAKKQEYLEYQRQLALQRMQEQEREMQMRLEQQKHMTQIRAMQNYGYPQLYGQPGAPQGYPGSQESSPHHNPGMAGAYPQAMGAPQPGMPPQPMAIHPPQGAPVPGQNQPQGTPGMIPHQGAPGQMPPQGAPGQMPSHGAMGHIPPQGAPGQIPPQGAPGQMPPQGAPGQMPPQGAPGQMPPQGAPGQMPPQGPPGQIPPQGPPGQMPPQGAPAPGGAQPSNINPSIQNIASQGGPPVLQMPPPNQPGYQTQPGYNPQQNTNNFNMQGIAGALPPGQAPGQPPQQIDPNMGQPSQNLGQPPQNPQAPNQQGFQQGAPGLPGHVSPAEQQQQQQQNDAQLISFD